MKKAKKLTVKQLRTELDKSITRVCKKATQKTRMKVLTELSQGFLGVVEYLEKEV